jgi:hypothetical protein
MAKVVEIKNVPSTDLAAVVASMTAEGATVNVQQQSDGKFTVRGTYPDEIKDHGG